MTDSKHQLNSPFAWMMVGVAFMLSALSFGILSSVGVFLKPLAAEFGWSRGSLAFGYTAVALMTAFSAIFWGTLSDKFGGRWIAVIGACGMTLTFFLLSTVDSLSKYYAFHLLFGLIGHGAVTGPLYAAVSLWFTRNIGLALGISVAGSAFGQGVIPFIARFLIDAGGWQSAYFYLGIGYLAVAVPIALMVRDSPRRTTVDAAKPPKMLDGTTFPLPPMTVVAWLASAVLFCCTAMSVPVVHLVPLLTDKGITPENAVTVFLVLMIAGAMGRIWGGKLADQIGALPSYAAMSVLQTSVIFVFPHADNIVLIYALAIIFGVAFSGVMASFLICVRMMVPSNVMARSMAVVGMFGWFGMGFGGWQGGWVFDLTGDYVIPFANGSAAGLVNIFILALFALHIRRGLRAQAVPQFAAG